MIEVIHNDAVPLKIPGEILDDSAYNALSIVTDEDVEQIPQTWARVMPPRYKFLISAEEIENNR